MSVSEATISVLIRVPPRLIAANNHPCRPLTDESVGILDRIAPTRVAGLPYLEIGGDVSRSAAEAVRRSRSI
jgi:hypothetical protein